MKRSLYFLLIAALTLLMTTVAAADSFQPAAADGVSAPVAQPLDATGAASYIVQLNDAPLALYNGGVNGLAATSAEAAGTFNIKSAAAIAYRAYLIDTQNAFVSAAATALGRDVTATGQLQYALNAVILTLTPDEAATLARLDGVKQITRERIEQLVTDSSPEWIGANNVWDGSATGTPNLGEGTVIAVLDTGINFDHPSFADPGPVDGYDFPPPPQYFGVCDPGDPQYNPAYTCNDKLIGAYSFVTEAVTPEDSDGHGSHTASTAAGNFADAVLEAPTITIEAQVKGVAPHAHVMSMDVCTAGCPTFSVLEAIDKIVELNGIYPGLIDAINYSISGGPLAWGDPVEEGFLSATAVGVFVSASAGNSGPDPSTAAHRSPWLTSVAAATQARTYETGIVNMSGGTNPPADMVGRAITAGYGPEMIVYAGDYDNGDPDPEQCLNPFPPGTWSGEIVVCDRGTIARVDKGANVLAGGAGGFVLANAASNGESTNADPHFLPAAHIGYADAQVLEAWLAGGSGHMATIPEATRTVNPANGDNTAGFSSRGPNDTFDTIIPDIMGPGVDIYAAVADGVLPPDGVDEFDFLSGTSMSSPHDAGVSLLLKSLHPDWSPPQIQSAIMTTAVYVGPTKEDNVTPADPFDMGAGRMQVDWAAQAGLVLDESISNFTDANPDLGGDPRALNIASMANSQCVAGNCSWTRTVMATVDGSWTASWAGDFPLTIEPASFSLMAGETQELTITADASGATPGDWTFSNVILTPAPANAPVNRPVLTGGDPGLARETTGADSNAPTGTAPALGDYQAPQDVLYDNGPLVNCAGCGAGGADESVLQSTTLLMSTLGFGHQFTVGNRIADDFTISDPDGWNIDQITFFGYQTNAPTNPSPITGVYYQIWDGPPNDPGSSVIFGDTGTNRLTNSTWANMYRVSETTQGTTGRAIFANVASAGVTLPAGTYWLDWMTDGSASYSGPWAPPITINGETTTGNAMQYTGTWGPANDGGTLTQQGFPFIIEGSVAGGGGGGSFSETSNPNLDIPDDAYDGSLGSMACDTIDASSIPGGETVSNVTLSLGATHTWIGDLTVKLQSPDGNILGVFSRVGYAEPADDGQGCCGDSSNLDGTPLLFDDASGDDAETMGNTIGSSEFVCTTDGRCDYYPNPDSVVGHSSFADFNGENASGMWMLCMGDSAGGDTGVFQEWTLNIEYGGGGGGGEIPEAHMPVAVIPVLGELPTEVNITTRRDAGSWLVPDNTAIEITDLTSTFHGPAPATITTEMLSQDPTNTDPYDNLNDGTTFWTSVTVNPGDLWFVAQITASEAPDIDLFVGLDTNGNGPELGEELCASTTSSWTEICEFDNPTPGDWWVLVQNWQESDNPPDEVTLATASVPDADAGLMWVEGPAAVPPGQPFDLRVYWDGTGLLSEGLVWYGIFDLGTDPGNPGNLGSAPVTLSRVADDVTKSVDNAAPNPGDTLTYTITVQPNVTNEDLSYMLTDTIPDGLTYVPGSASASFGTVDVVGNQLTWTGTMVLPGYTYQIATSDTDPGGCTAPLATDGAYVDLAAYGITPDPTVFGDTVDYSVNPTGGPFSFFGEYQGELIHFTDDGFAFFEPSTPGAQPWVNEPIPTAGDPDNLMAMFWRDMEIVYDAGTNRGVTIANLTSGGQPVAVVIEYDDVEDWPAGGNPTYDFELVAYYEPDPGEYEYVFAYNNLTGDVTAGTIGLENADGSAGVQYAYNDIAVTDGMAVCFDFAPVVQEPATITYQVTVDQNACGTLSNEVVHDTDNPGSMPAMTQADVTVECGGAQLTLDYTYYTRGGGTISGTLSFYDDGTYMDESGGMGAWQFIPNPPRIRFIYTDGSRCGAISQGHYAGNLQVQGYWACTDGSGRWGTWDASIVTGFENGIPTTPLGAEALPAFK